MPSIEYSVDKRDLTFLLYEQLKADKSLLALEPYSHFDKETFDMVVDEAIRLGTTVLGPINREGDLVGAVFKDGNVTMPKSFIEAYKSFQEGGWLGINRSAEWGGQGFPELFGILFLEIMTGANPAFALVSLLNQGTGNLIEAFGSDEQKQTYCEKIYTGEWSATMCLTEPEAGSDVGALKTTAVPNGDHYLIKGTKIFITYGEHDMSDNIIHAVLAKTPDAPAGTKGISLFIVPKYLLNEDGSMGEQNDVVCGRIEHKMGINASPTCVMNFGENDACKGWLLGEVNQGMPYMFQMMNEARLGVGVQGLAGASASYMSALGYANQRKQGARVKDPTAPRAEIVQHPDVRRMLLRMKAYSEALRALIYQTAVYIDLSHHDPNEENRRRYNELVELLTPICKSYASDKGFKATEDAIQVYGGYGYTQEYPVEQFCRDTKIASVYEGTNGIQAIDLVLRKLLGRGGSRFETFLKSVDDVLEANADTALTSVLQALKARRDQTVDITKQLLGKVQKGDLDYGLLNASNLLELFGNFTCAFYLSQGAFLASNKLQAIYEQNGVDPKGDLKAFLRSNAEAAFYYGKVCSAQFFTQQILPQNDSLAAGILSDDRSALDILFLDEP